MLKFLLLMAAFALSVQVQALEYHIDLPNSQPVGLVVIAPAKKYLMEERLFTRIAQSLAQRGLIVMRFNWNAVTFQDPAREVTRASADVLTAVNEARAAYGFSSEKTAIISKSFATKSLGLVLGAAKAQVLLTPNCSSDAPFADTYAPLLQLVGVKLSIAISTEDPYCDANQIVQTVANIAKPPRLFLTHGDHNFVAKNPAEDFTSQDQVVEFVTSQVLKDLVVSRSGDP